VINNGAGGGHEENHEEGGELLKPMVFGGKLKEEKREKREMN